VHSKGLSKSGEWKRELRNAKSRVDAKPGHGIQRLYLQKVKRGNGTRSEIIGQKSNERYAAAQASVQLRRWMNRNLTCFTEYGRLFPGEFLRQSTPGRNINYWTAWLDIRY
jgi:hypothetical protein